MTKEMQTRFLNYLEGDDLDFYEEFVMNLSDEEQLEFLEENPKFMYSYGSDKDNFLILKDKSYRNILRKIKRNEGNR